MRASRDAAPATGTPARWIYEPDLCSRQAYARYLRYAWPGTAIVIDDEQPEPRLLELLADLNPLAGGPGLPAGMSAAVLPLAAAETWQAVFGGLIPILGHRRGRLASIVRASKNERATPATRRGRGRRPT